MLHQTLYDLLFRTSLELNICRQQACILKEFGHFVLIIYAKFHEIFPKQSLHLSEICMKHFVLCLFRCNQESLYLGKFCSCSELVMPETIYSLDHCITVVFKPNGSVPGEEFEAYYTSTDNTTELDPTSNCRSVNKI